MLHAGMQSGYPCPVPGKCEGKRAPSTAGAWHQIVKEQGGQSETRPGSITASCLHSVNASKRQCPHSAGTA